MADRRLLAIRASNLVLAWYSRVSAEILAGDTPNTLNLLVHDKLVDAPNPGDRLKVRGQEFRQHAIAGLNLLSITLLTVSGQEFRQHAIAGLNLLSITLLTDTMINGYS